MSSPTPSGSDRVPFLPGTVFAGRYRIVTRGEAPTSPLYPLAHLGLGRASALAGNIGTARTAYETLFALWRGVGSAVPPMAETRQEYTRLR